MMSGIWGGPGQKNMPMDISKLPAIADEAAARLETTTDRLMLWAWPQVFGSTSGPRGGIGGAAMLRKNVRNTLDYQLHPYRRILPQNG